MGLGFESQRNHGVDYQAFTVICRCLISVFRGVETSNSVVYLGVKWYKKTIVGLPIGLPISRPRNFERLV